MENYVCGVGGCTFNDILHGCLHTGEIEQKENLMVFQEKYLLQIYR